MLDATPVSVDTRGEQDTISRLHFLLPPELVATGEALFAGDLWWATEERSYGVELKSTPDGLSSLWSKEHGDRLEWQLERLRGAVDVPILGWHGLRLGPGDEIVLTDEPTITRGGDYYAKRIKSTGYHKSSVDGFLWAAGEHGVRIVERATKEDLLRALVEVYWWSRKRPEDHRAFRGHVRRAYSPVSARRNPQGPSLTILAAFPGVGENRALKLLERFGSLEAVLGATEGELTGCPGVGKGIAKRIRGVMEAKLEC